MCTADMTHNADGVRQACHPATELAYDFRQACQSLSEKVCYGFSYRENSNGSLHTESREFARGDVYQNMWNVKLEAGPEPEFAGRIEFVLGEEDEASHRGSIVSVGRMPVTERREEEKEAAHGVSIDEDLNEIITPDFSLATISTGAKIFDAAENADRSRTQSLTNLPHDMRGITLAELREFYDSEKAWIEEVLWSCEDCHENSDIDQGPCHKCGSLHGRMRARNLYEVVDRTLKPLCKEEQVSYVEHIARRRVSSDFSGEAKRCQPVDTFVSHWWGEEFPKFVATLDRYARMRCKETRRWGVLWITFFSTTCLSAFLCVHFLRSEEQDVWDLSLSSKKWLIIPIFACPLLIFVVMKFVMKFTKKDRDPMTWCFWICAFANNQYAIDHAIVGGDVMKSSFALALRGPSCKEVLAVLDGEVQIYNRIWCAFELFFSAIVGPRSFSKRFQIALANEFGVISDGDASAKMLARLRSALNEVHTEQAQASVQADKDMIKRKMDEEGITYKQLDGILQSLSENGFRAASIRRRAPLAMFCATPLISVSMQIGSWSVIKWVHFDKLSCGWFDCDHLALISLLFSVLTSSCLVYGIWRPGRCPQQQRLAMNCLSELLIINASPFGLCSLGAVGQLFHLDDDFSDDFFMSAVCATWALSIPCIYSAIIGGIYSCVRDLSRFTKIRRWMEDGLCRC